MTQVSRLPRDDAAERLRQLDETADLLWPGARRVRQRGPGRSGELLIGPSARLPRVLLPAANPRAAATALVAQGTGSSPMARLQRRALASATRLGLAPWLMPDRLRPDPAQRSIVTQLSDVLGRPVVISTPLSAARANRKPVLQLLDTRGGTLGWAKIAVDDLTGGLVEHEADVLTALARTSGLPFRPPDVVHVGTWQGRPFVVLSPLPTTGAGRVAEAPLTRAMRALAETPMPSRDDGPSYVHSLGAQIDALLGEVGSEDGAALVELRDALTELRPAIEAAALPTGTWHGDWTPWNCRQRDADVLVWDWERCVGGVPLGFDPLHYRMQEALIARRTPHPVAARDCIADAPRTLAEWSLPDTASSLTAALYLTELAVRYIRDGQRAAVGHGGQVELWIVPAVREYVSSTKPNDVRGT
jgi:hypothetical protein